MQGSGLRVAVVLDANGVPEWHRSVAESVRALEGVVLTAVIAAESQAARPRVEPSHAALRRMAIDDVVPDVPRIRYATSIARGTSFDVLIDLAGVDLDCHPPYGVWRYGFGDGRPFANGASGTVVRLYRLTADPERAVVLGDGWYRARTPDAWGTRSVAARVAPWCARALQQIAGGDEEALEVATGSPQSTAGCLDMEPPDAPLSRVVAVADTLRTWLRRERWTIGLVAAPIEDILASGALPEPIWLRDQPPDRFYADPFPVACCGDAVRVLVEDYRYHPKRKGLSELEIGRDGRLRRAVDQETLPPRASYPFLLRRDGELICIPETSSADAAMAFARDGATGKWSALGDLVRGFRVIDPTLVEWNGRWWLFCTKQGDEDQTELYLFCAPSWDGPWNPHPLNPVKSDTRSSRPAGQCFETGGVLYRPAQNCARRYGAGITINRIVELTPRRFREEPVLSLLPSPSSPWPDGLHTINSLDDVTVVDGLRVERRW
ncbi:MAG: hypothetical protein A3G76_00470 [Acidobacteria bacterium RIFCSPLOWO2_12_FULL_65_11]|nr:MAG: hypothetical protein A3H95_06545 [Acidobacteria bacterium RIFCSPLOWO2_02_FULL_64_15]OFW34124.1 MAG: hypothetical protein A3G76_00470 [Acidobacteria bacterium RIFCSPLOWO2_12_FULL_65_11]